MGKGIRGWWSWSRVKSLQQHPATVSLRGSHGNANFPRRALRRSCRQTRQKLTGLLECASNGVATGIIREV